MKYNFSFETTEKETEVLVGAFNQLTSTLMVMLNRPSIPRISLPPGYVWKGCGGCGDCVDCTESDEQGEPWSDGCRTKSEWYGTDNDEAPTAEGAQPKAEPKVEPKQEAEPEPQAKSKPEAEAEPPAPEYITLKVDNGSVPSQYGEQPVMTIRKPTYEDVKTGMLLFSQFLRNFTMFWETGQHTAGALKMRSQRQICMLELAAGPILLPVKQYFLRCGSLNKAVYYVLASWHPADFAARFNVMPQRVSGLLAYAQRIATLIIQMAHACAPELVHFFDHSSNWMRGLNEQDDHEDTVPLDLRGVLDGQRPSDMEIKIGRMTWPKGQNEYGERVDEDGNVIQDTEENS